VTILQVKQNGQDEEHHHTGHDALFVHEWGRPRAATSQREAETALSR
jgi:hypothetical protein